MALDSFSSRPSSDVVPTSSDQGGAEALSLPGLGFSLWTERSEAAPIPVASAEALFVGKGFSLPDAKQPLQARTHVLRGFSKNQITRIVRPTLKRTADETRATISTNLATHVAEIPAAPKAKQEAKLSSTQDPIEPKSATTEPPQTTTAKTTNTHFGSASAPPEECTIDPSQPMTSPTSVHLPGNGFSVWTQQSPASHALSLVSNSSSDADQGAPIGSSGSGGSDSGTTSNFKTYPEPSKGGGGGGFLKWAALFLFLCALGAFLSSESGRKKVIAERDGLEAEKVTLIDEKKGLHDNLIGEQTKTAKLTEEVGGLETSLTESKANITALTAEKTGLSKIVEQLKGTLATTIEEATNTEMMLQKAIAGLETKNEQITSNLQKEREKLSGLDTRLSEVMAELSTAKASNQKLVEEKAGLEDKVAQLQSMLDKTVKDAETSEQELRSELAALKKANEDLTTAFNNQKKALSDTQEKLKASDEALAEDKKAEENTQSQVNDLTKKLEDAVAARDSLNEDKQALAASVAQMTEQIETKGATSPTTVALEKRITDLESGKSSSDKQVKELAAARDALLHRNADLQASVESLNGHLSKLAESEETQEGTLTKRITELTKTNESLQQSLKKQRTEFNTLLRSANSVSPVGEPSASNLKGAMNDLKATLAYSLERETSSREQLNTLIGDHTDQMLELNTRVAKTQSELESTKGLLSELDGLRNEVRNLRSQGETLESELAQRATHISTLNEDNATWQQETDKLRNLLQTEQLAQNKLREFANDLQLRITDLETPSTQAVANK